MKSIYAMVITANEKHISFHEDDISLCKIIYKKINRTIFIDQNNI